MQRDPYKILRVPPTADQDEIETAYRHLAKQYHPDLNKSPDATLRMQEINWAYDLIKDPDSRWKYDRDSGWQSSVNSATRPANTPGYNKTAGSTYTAGPAPSASYPSSSSDASKQAWKRRWKEDLFDLADLVYKSGFSPIAFVLFVFFLMSGTLGSWINQANSRISYSTSYENEPVFEEQGDGIEHSLVMTRQKPTLSPGIAQGADTLECQHWKKINWRDLGKEVCVYGKVYEVLPASDGFAIVRFANYQTSLVVVDDGWGAWDLEPNQCVAAVGVVEESPSTVSGGLSIHGESYSIPCSKYVR